MKFQYKIIFLSCTTIICILLVLNLDPIAQDINYHNFTDKVTFLSIPNFNNVISNIGFVIIGIYGLINNYKKIISSPLLILLLLGFFFTGLGSSYYHWKPNNVTLVYDRLPMVLVFMTFFTFIISTYISKKHLLYYSIVFVFLGFGSVFYWSFTESIGNGDLRPYVLIQFLPILLIPLIIILFKNKANKSIYIIPIIGCYIIAKFCEHFDKQVYVFTSELLSGHSIKHLFAALAAYYIYKWMTVLQKTL